MTLKFQVRNEKRGEPAAYPRPAEPAEGAEEEPPEPAAISYTARLAVREDIPRLAAVERSAASIFRTISGLEWIADGDTASAELLSSMIDSATLWVVTWDRDRSVVGFLASYPIDGHLHVAELSVEFQHQRRGLGAGLMECFERYARENDYKSLSLTTDTKVKWNLPFYVQLGFRRMSPFDADQLGPGHVKKLADEEAAGFNLKRRCIMVKDLDAQEPLSANFLP